MSGRSLRAGRWWSVFSVVVLGSLVFGSSAGAANPPAAVPDQFREHLDEDDEFIEIIERDEGLDETPPTGYVPSGVEPDETFHIQMDERPVYLGKGVIHDGFSVNGMVPGPMLRAEQGDVVRVQVANEGSVVHGASIHAADTQTSRYLADIPPGETVGVSFRVNQPGVFMYHCAPGGHAIPMHMLGGMYGMMVVEPEDDYKLEQQLDQPPDLKLYLVQHELYADGETAVDGPPAYTMFNGELFRYVREPIPVEPGDYVRIYFLNVGPNILSTFHIVGVVWDYVYWQGHPEARWPGGQTVTAGPSDSWVIEFRVPPDEGPYTMLSHAAGPTSRGTIGLLEAEAGADGPDEVVAEGPEYTDEQLEQLRDDAVRTIAPFRPGSENREHPEVYGLQIDEVVVEMKGNAFNPSVIEIEEGTTVTWVNEDVFMFGDGEVSGAHNAVATEGPEQFAIPLLEHGERASVTFETPGEYTYICTPHPYMEGKIIVRESEEERPRGCSAGGGGPAAPVVVVVAMAVVAVLRVARHPGEG